VGLDGQQGVVVPCANVEHLMLREDVAEAARKGQFHIYAVETADEAMEVLTDLPAGRPDESGETPEGTLNHLVEQQLLGFAVVTRRFADLVEVDEYGRRKRRRSRRKS